MTLAWLASSLVGIDVRIMPIIPTTANIAEIAKNTGVVNQVSVSDQAGSNVSATTEQVYGPESPGVHQFTLCATASAAMTSQYPKLTLFTASANGTGGTG